MINSLLDLKKYKEPLKATPFTAKNHTNYFRQSRSTKLFLYTGRLEPALQAPSPLKKQDKFQTA